MNILTWNDFISGSLNSIGSVALSIGVFDGIHDGHRQLLNSIISNDKKKSIVVTFRDNPRIFLKDETYLGDIFTLPQKLEILSSLGVDIVILIDFSHDFSRLSGKDFLYLIQNNCNLSYLILGENFKCGYMGMTTAYEVSKILDTKKVMIDIGEMNKFENQLISSSRIREAIASGCLYNAQEMLKSIFSFDFSHIPQVSEGKNITVKTKYISQVIPPQGHYTVLAGTSHNAQRSKMFLREGEIIVFLQKLQHLDFVKFILE